MDGRSTRKLPATGAEASRLPTPQPPLSVSEDPTTVFGQLGVPRDSEEKRRDLSRRTPLGPDPGRSSPASPKGNRPLGAE